MGINEVILLIDCGRTLKRESTGMITAIAVKVTSCHKQRGTKSLEVAESPITKPPSERGHVAIL